MHVQYVVNKAAKLDGNSVIYVILECNRVFLHQYENTSSKIYEAGGLNMCVHTFSVLQRVQSIHADLIALYLFL